MVKYYLMLSFVKTKLYANEAMTIAIKSISICAEYKSFILADEVVIKSCFFI